MSATQTETRQETKPRDHTKEPQAWNVVLLDDDDHSPEYVILMMLELFNHPAEKGYTIAETVHHQGRAVCLTTHKEHAELKRDQIHAYGRDRSIAECKGSMSAIIEPAEFDGDDDEKGGGGAPGGGDAKP